MHESDVSAPQHVPFFETRYGYLKRLRGKSHLHNRLGAGAVTIKQS